MLSRRVLIGSTAVLAAGCGGLDFPFPELGAPKTAPLTWLSRPFTSLSTGPRISSFEEKLQRIVRELAASTESPFGPTRGRYNPNFALRGTLCRRLRGTVPYTGAVGDVVGRVE